MGLVLRQILLVMAFAMVGSLALAEPLPISNLMSGDPNLGDWNAGCGLNCDKANPQTFSREMVSSMMQSIGDLPFSKKIAKTAHSLSTDWEDGHCLRSVREVLTVVGEWTRGMISKYSRDAAETLQQAGFVNLAGPGGPMEKLKDPCLAPVGALIVYKGGPKLHHGQDKCHGPCGHVEFKVGDNEYDAQRRDHRPITGCAAKGSTHGNEYEVVAILISPKVFSQAQPTLQMSSNLPEHPDQSVRGAM